MLKNYFKVAIRIISRYKLFSLLNILGLAIGMAVSLLILLWVNNQNNYDKSQENRNNIYRMEAPGWVDMPTSFTPPLSDLPEIIQIVRFNHWEFPTIKYENFLGDIENFVFADDGVFDVFNFDFIEGDPNTALEAPFSLVLTESTAVQIFGNDEPVGKTVLYNNNFSFTVTGLIKDVEDLHININALASFSLLPKISGRPNFLNEANWNFLMYLHLEDNVNTIELTKKINKALLEKAGYKDNDIILRSFNEIYFEKNLGHEKGVKHGNKQLVIIFIIIAIFILLIACINFLNLTTAGSANRAKEVSGRKVVGAQKKTLIMQFMGETLLIVFIAHILAMFLIEALLPLFNNLTGENIDINYSDPKLLLWIISTIIITSLFAGLYPAFYLSSFNPLEVLKGKNARGGKSIYLRRILIVIQFSISILLLIGSITIVKQLNYMKEADLGFNQDQIIIVPLKGELRTEKKQVFKEELLKNPDILNITFSGQIPGAITSTNTWNVNGEKRPMVIVNSDPDYVDVMELELIQGRNLSYDITSDFAVKYIINEEAVKFLEFDDPIGKIVTANFGTSEIIGVFKDFHFNSLHSKIGPLAIVWFPRWANNANIRISGNNISQTRNYIQNIWNDMCPDLPFTSDFLDESFAQQYEKEMKLADSVKYFAFLAIVLACLGLFGLSAYIAAQKTKEIGIRKVLGASVGSIVILLSKEFLKWVLISNIIAWPLSYFLLRKWIQNYAYYTDISWWIFIVAALSAIIISIITVGFQAIKASNTRPAESLRFE
ncbi:ABC transporter permease [Bacteroidota bacterium]